MNLQQFIKNKTLGLFVKTNGLVSEKIFAGLGFIICLHRVLPKNMHDKFWGNSGMAVSPEYLQWLITKIQSSGIEIISIDEALSRIKSGKSKRRFAVLTLDDGWQDNLLYGLPVFEKNNSPFTIYVTNCFAENSAYQWAEELTEVISVNTSVEYTVDDKEFSFSLKSRAEKVAAYNSIRLHILNSASKAEFDKKLNAVLGGKLIKNKASAMSWDEVKQLSKHKLCTIGAHTVNHLPLAKLTEADAFAEISNSKKIIEEKIGAQVRHFAYPFGTKNECSAREFSLAARAGFEMSVTGRQGNVFYGNAEHLMAVPRYPIGENTDETRLYYIMNGILHFSFNGFKKIVTD